MRIVFRCDPALAATLVRPVAARQALPDWIRRRIAGFSQARGQCQGRLEEVRREPDRRTQGDDGLLDTAKSLQRRSFAQPVGSARGCLGGTCEGEECSLRLVGPLQGEAELVPAGRMRGKAVQQAVQHASCPRVPTSSSRTQAMKTGSGCVGASSAALPK